jgi:hypothetical protein
VPSVSDNPQQLVRIEGSDRVFIAGMTGSGKTFWAMHMLAAQPRLVVIDLKHSDEIGKWPWDRADRQSQRNLERGRAVRVRVQDEGAALDWLALAYRSGGCIVYVDEIFLLVPQGTRSPIEVQEIWRAGRERGVGGWVATQRPSWLPKELLSEADWTVCFRLKLEDDRKTMARDGGLGDDVLTPVSDPHGFYIGHTTWESPRYFPELSAEMHVDRARAIRKELAQ